MRQSENHEPMSWASIIIGIVVGFIALTIAFWLFFPSPAKAETSEELEARFRAAGKRAIAHCDSMMKLDPKWIRIQRDHARFMESQYHHLSRLQCGNAYRTYLDVHGVHREPDSIVKDSLTAEPVSPAYKFLKPSTIEVAASFRSAKDPDAPTDYEVSGGVTWARVRSTVLYEREDGRYYWGYESVADTAVSENWRLELASMLHEAAGIDRQTLVALYDWIGIDMGCGLTTVRWSGPEGVAMLRFPIRQWVFRGPYLGGFAYAVAPGLTHIVNIDLDIASKTAVRYRPFVRGFYRADGSEIWKFKTGISIIL